MPALVQQIRSLILWAVVALVAANVAAQPGPGAGSPADSADLSHAWVVVEAETGARLLHLSPRRTPFQTETTGSSPGTARVALPLSERPGHLGSWKDQVFLIFEPEKGEQGSLRRVMSLGAIKLPLDDFWEYVPAGRLRAHASLPGEGQIVSVRGTALGLFTLLDSGGEPRLMLLEPEGWREVEGPGTLTGPIASDSALVAFSRGMGVVSRVSGGMWVWEFEDERSIIPTWQWRALAFADQLGEPLPSGEVAFTVVHDALFMTARRATGVTVYELTERRAIPIGVLDDLDPRAVLVPLSNVRRLAAIWRVPDEEKNDESPVRIRELSVETGLIVYDGPVHARPPVSAREFRLLAGVMLGVMFIVLLLAIKPDRNRDALVLPEGVALADPARRLLGGGVDFLVAVVLAHLVLGRPLNELASPLGLMSLLTDLNLMLTIAACGIGHCAFAEWLLARSPGKFLAGTGVTTTLRSDQLIKPSLVQAFIRNGVKWLLPPLALLGVAESDGRHRGDLAARTVVVMPRGDNSNEDAHPPTEAV